MNPATHQRICAEIQERHSKELAAVTAHRDELAKLCNYNEQVLQELLQQRDFVVLTLRTIRSKHGAGIVTLTPADLERIDDAIFGKVGAGTTARPPTPTGWSDTDWIKHLQEQQHPLSGLHINQGSMDAAADAYEAEYNARHNALAQGPGGSSPGPAGATS